MSCDVTFCPIDGGVVAYRDGHLAALILPPLPDESHWRILTEHGDIYRSACAHSAQTFTRELFILDALIS